MYQLKLVNIEELFFEFVNAKSWQEYLFLRTSETIKQYGTVKDSLKFSYRADFNPYSLTTYVNTKICMWLFTAV